MRAKKVVELRRQEQKILATLVKLQGHASVEQLICETGLPEAAIMRAALTLQEKALIRIHAEMQTVIKLTAEGETNAKLGLPERRLVNAVMALGGKAVLDRAAAKAALHKQFTQIALGWTQRKKWLKYDSKTNTLSAASSPEEEMDEKLLNRLIKSPEPLTSSKLNDKEKIAVQTLKKRQLLTTADKTTRILEITDEGKQAKQKNRRRSHTAHARTHYHRQMANHQAPKIQHNSSRRQNLAWKETSLPCLPRRSPRKTH